MKKMNLTNNQKAFEYAVYMIASSYFKTCKCKSKILEKNLFLQYQEQKINSQYEMEEICICFMEELSQKLPKDFFEQDMEVHFIRREKTPLEILFKNEKYIMSFSGRYAAKNSLIDYSVWKKKIA